jgi:hypothetical protein
MTTAQAAQQAEDLRAQRTTYALPLRLPLDDLSHLWAWAKHSRGWGFDQCEDFRRWLEGEYTEEDLGYILREGWPFFADRYEDHQREA